MQTERWLGEKRWTEKVKTGRYEAREIREHAEHSREIRFPVRERDIREQRLLISERRNTEKHIPKRWNTEKYSPERCVPGQRNPEKSFREKRSAG